MIITPNIILKGTQAARILSKSLHHFIGKCLQTPKSRTQIFSYFTCFLTYLYNLAVFSFNKLLSKMYMLQIEEKKELDNKKSNYFIFYFPLHYNLLKDNKSQSKNFIRNILNIQQCYP